MNWIESIYNLTTLWNILKFDLLLVSNQPELYPRYMHAFLNQKDFLSEKLEYARAGNRNLLIFYRPLTVSEFTQIFEKVSEAHKNATSSTSSIYHFVLWPELTADAQEICSKLTFHSLTLASNVFVLTADLRNRAFLYEVYLVVNNTLTCRMLENFDCTDFIELTNKIGRRNDFQSVVITATAAVQANTASEVFFTEVNGRIVSATGSAVHIFQDLMTMLNFKGNFTRGDWVMRNSTTKKLHGISVDQLRSGSAQLYLTQTTLAPYRATEFNFLQPTFQDRLNAFFRQPPSSSVSDVHISPFQTSLWLTIFGTWALLSLSAFAISWIKLDLEDEDSSIVNRVERLHEAVIWAIGAGCTQGWYRFPKSTSLRIVLFCGAVSGLVNFVTYSGAIISSLTSEVVPIRSLLDLLSSSLEIYFDEDSSTLRYIVQDLKNTTSMRKGGFAGTSVATGLSSILQGPSALFGFSRNLYFEAIKMNLTAHSLCSSISNVPIQKLPLQNGMLVPKWSPYREFFNHRIIQLKERGFNFRYSKTFLTETSIPCSPILHSYREDLGMLDVFTAFAILLGGTLLAILLLLIEKCLSIKEILHKYTRSTR